MSRNEFALVFALAMTPTLLASSGCAGTQGGDGDGSTEGETDEQGLPPIDPSICAGMEFDNIVDEASCDEIQGRGIEPVFADEVEMCRRLYVDLTGALPSPAEFEDDCEGRSVEGIVDRLMDREAYVKLGQRRWADHFLMTSDITLYTYVEELDDLSGELYRGNIKLPEFAELATTHPGFTGRFDGQDLVGYSFQAFLGRDAAPHERIGLEPLWHMWQERFEEQHPEYYFNYQRVVVNSILCMGSLEAACHSELWGHHSVVLPVVEEGNYDYDGVNVYPEEDLTSDEWDTLRLPGRLIAQQGTFYETAADRALDRYLGYPAGSQIPLVRQRLVDMLHDSGGDVRELEREVLTSQLYTMEAQYPDPEDTAADAGAPDFWHGPVKQLEGEAWLDSVEKLSGLDVGHCDHRFPDVAAGRPEDDSPYEDTWWHPNDYPLDENWPAERNKPDYAYRDMARGLGGCPDQQGQLRFTGVGVMIAINYNAIAADVCEFAPEGSLLHPSGTETAGKSSAELEGIARELYGNVLTRAAPEELDDAISAAVEACRDATDCEPTDFRQHTCLALLESAPFIFP